MAKRKVEEVELKKQEIVLESREEEMWQAYNQDIPERPFSREGWFKFVIADNFFGPGNTAKSYRKAYMRLKK